MYTQEQWKQYEEMQSELKELAEEYMYGYGTGGSAEELTGYEINGDNIEIKTEAYYSGCGTEHDWLTVPLYYLWTEDWGKIEEARRNKIKLQQEEKEAAAKAVQKEKDDATEKAKYLELHKKYGANHE